MGGNTPPHTLAAAMLTADWPGGQPGSWSEALEVIQESSSIRLQLQSLPASVTLVRAMLSGIGERFELDPELTDDLKTAVSEACNNVVLHAYPGGAGPLDVELDVDRDALRISVIDSGEGIRHVAATDDRMGVGLAVISALADRAEFQSLPEGGTAVRMSFGARGRPISVHGDGGDRLVEALDLQGDVRITVVPVGLLGDVLGRVARAIAAGAHFSLDRFSDLYLITDELGAHARTAAAGSEIGAALCSASGRLEITAGPFVRGTGEELSGGRGSTAFSFTKLVNELQVESYGDGELLHVTVVDARR